MSVTDSPSVASIPASIENSEAWESIAASVETRTGLPAVATAEMIAGMIAGAVALLFAADATGTPGLLRGTFADRLVAQCAHNRGNLMGEEPLSALITLIGVHMMDGHAVVRVRLTISVRTTEGAHSVNRQFWDLQLGGQVTVAQPTCPNCGAPIGTGELICGHCRADVRSVADVPVVVSRLEIY